MQHAAGKFFRKIGQAIIPDGEKIAQPNMQDKKTPSRVKEMLAVPKKEKKEKVNPPAENGAPTVLAPPQPSVFEEAAPDVIAPPDFGSAAQTIAPPSGKVQKESVKSKKPAQKNETKKEKKLPDKTELNKSAAQYVSALKEKVKSVPAVQKVAGLFANRQGFDKTPAAQKPAPKVKSTKNKSAGKTASAGTVPKYPGDIFDPLDDLAPPAAPFVPSGMPDLPDLSPIAPPQKHESPEPVDTDADTSAEAKKTPRPKVHKKTHDAKKAPAKTEEKNTAQDQPKKQAAKAVKVPVQPKKENVFAKQRSRAKEKADARRAREARLQALEHRLHRDGAQAMPRAERPLTAEEEAAIKASKAAARVVRIVLIVLSCLAVVAAIGLIAGFSLTISSEAKRSSAFASNSATVCAQYLTEYGEGEYTDSSEDTYDLYSLQGFFGARRIDFDGDGYEELLLLYNNEGKYYGDIWGLNQEETFTKLYTVPFCVNEETGETWIVLYKTGSKYYLGTQSGSMESDITFYRLKGDTFTEVNGKATYNDEKDTYRRLARNITTRLEFLKVTMLTQRQAESMLSDLQEMIDSFGSTSASAQSDLTDAQRRAQAYLNVVDELSAKYGAGAIDEDGTCLHGLAVVRLVDFDGDGTEELLVTYEREITEVDDSSDEYSTYSTSHYVMEVYRCSGSAATLIFTNETLVTPSFDEDARLLMLQASGEETRICTVTRDVDSSSSGRYTARVYQMGDDTFNLLYSAEVEDTYGTKRYTIDGERVDADQFSENGMTVPYFYKNDDTPDDTYTVLYLTAGEDNADDIRKTLNDTKSTVEDLRAELD